MLASFTDELGKIAAGGNVADPTKAVVGGMGANVVGKPLPSPGIGTGSVSAKPAKPTNYSMVHSNAPMAADLGSIKAPAPPVAGA